MELVGVRSMAAGLSIRSNVCPLKGESPIGIASSCTSNEGDNRHLPLFIPPTGRIPFVGGIFSLFGLGVETSRSYYQHNQAVARTVTETRNRSTSLYIHHTNVEP